MRILFSVLGLLFVVLIIGVLAKKQLAAVAPAPAASVAVPGAALPDSPQPGSPQPTASEIMKSIDAIMQQPRPALQEK